VFWNVKAFPAIPTCVEGVMSESHAWCMVSRPTGLPFATHALHCVKNINTKLIKNFLLFHSELIPSSYSLVDNL
jgi:hypothetical protein